MCTDVVANKVQAQIMK